MLARLRRCQNADPAGTRLALRADAAKEGTTPGFRQTVKKSPAKLSQLLLLGLHHDLVWERLALTEERDQA